MAQSTPWYEKYDAWVTHPVRPERWHTHGRLTDEIYHEKWKRLWPLHRIIQSQAWDPSDQDRMEKLGGLGYADRGCVIDVNYRCGDGDQVLENLPGVAVRRGLGTGGQASVFLIEVRRDNQAPPVFMVAKRMNDGPEAMQRELQWHKVGRRIRSSFLAPWSRIG